MVLEDGSLRLDTKVPDPQTGEYTLQRVVIGDGAEWEKILQKPFEALSADFTVTANSNTGVDELFISDSYKFNNKSTLDKFSESGGSLLFDGQPIVAGGISIKGRVDTGNLLPDEGTNQEGDIYLVGYGSDAQTPSSVYNKYIWIATDTQTPRWEPLFLTQYSWSMITDKPTINSHALEGNVTLADIGAAAASDVTAIKAMIADSFSTESAYAVDDYVIYNNALYKFTSAHVAGAWNSAEVTAIQVSDMIGSGGGGSSDINVVTTGAATDAASSISNIWT